MHLINPLVAGIRGAEIGSIELLERGTSTHAVYYKDFPATQQYSVQPIPLDSFGSVTLYVDELVDVLVHDQNGVLVRQFVAGDYAAAVEVISQSFTGTDYRDGTIGPHRPTNLASVLDLWKTNAGAIDWKVLVGGNVVTIGDALSSFAGLYFNVKSYGALGNGIADDGAAINAACAAAAAVGGGTVFFPPGVYRTTVIISIPNNVCFLGSGAPASKIAIDNAGSSCITYGPGPADSGARTIRNLWIGSINAVNTQSLVLTNFPTLRTVFEDCLFGNDATTKGVHATIQTATLDSLVQFNRCSFYEMAGATIINMVSSGVGRSVFRDCEFKSLFTGFTSAPHIVAIDGMLIDGCRFDASALAGGVFAYILMTPLGQFGGNKFINSRFKKGPATLAAFRTTTPTPGFGVWESGNSFGDTNTGFLPLYLDSVSDGYAGVFLDTVGLRTHGSRLSRCFGADTNVNVQIDAKNYALAVINRTGLGAQTISATLGSMGDPLVVQVINGSGSPLNFGFGSMFSLPSGALPAIPIAGTGQYQFMFLPVVAGGFVGKWVLTGTSFGS